MKRRIVINGPCYKNEFSIYTKDTLDKIEGFRRARSHWLSIADESQKASAKVKEGMKESNLYTGRCSCLRKLQLKTTLLRVHYKDLRPERYWTFRKKLTEQDIEGYDALEGGVEVKRREPKRRGSDMVCSSLDAFNQEDLEACMREAEKTKGIIQRKQRKRECKEKQVSGPCRKAIKRLRASKLRDGIVESCKCDEGREVTVVIKGICLCDTTNLRKVNLNKVCDEYSRMQKASQPPAEGALEYAGEGTKEIGTTDINKESTDNKLENLNNAESAETYRRLKSLQEMEDKGRNDKAKIEETAAAPKKKLTFENEKNLKGDGGEKHSNKVSDVTVFRKLSSDFLKTSDVGPKIQPPASSQLPVKSLAKHDSILGPDKPVGVPQSESLNNLLINEETITKPTGQPKKYSPAGQRKLPDENKKPLESVHLSNSLEIYKKHLKHSQKKEEPAKTEKTQSEEDLGGTGENQPTEKKTKVRVSKKPTIIPSSEEETTPSPNPETKIPKKPLERQDLITHEKSWKKNAEKEAVESKSEVNSDEDKRSLVTLYKNKPEEKSELGLTKEEFEIIKQKENQKNEEGRKKNLEKSTATLSAN